MLAAISDLESLPKAILLAFKSDFWSLPMVYLAGFQVKFGVFV